MCACVRVCVRACVRACVGGWVGGCVCVGGWGWVGGWVCGCICLCMCMRNADNRFRLHDIDSLVVGPTQEIHDRLPENTLVNAPT